MTSPTTSRGSAPTYPRSCTADPRESPCPTCTTGADCATCPAFDQWLAHLDQSTPECLLCADMALLLDAGEHLPRIAERLGRKPESLRQHARRHHLIIPADRREYAA